MNWFEALQHCRNEDRGADLFSIESSTERVDAQIAGILRTGYRSSQGNIDGANGNALLWLVNAHVHLYNRDALTWATGRLLDKSANHKFWEASWPVCRTIPVRNCSGVRGGIEAECFAISVTRHISGRSWRDWENIMLVDVQCTAERAYREICKRHRDQKSPSTSVSMSKYRFVPSQWIRSPIDGTV